VLVFVFERTGRRHRDIIYLHLICVLVRSIQRAGEVQVLVSLVLICFHLNAGNLIGLLPDGLTTHMVNLPNKFHAVLSAWTLLHDLIVKASEPCLFQKLSVRLELVATNHVRAVKKVTYGRLYSFSFVELGENTESGWLLLGS